MNISFDNFRDLSNEMNVVIEKIKNNFDNVQNAYKTLTGSGNWNSQSAEQFNSNVNELANNLNASYTELKACIQYLNAIDMRYKNLENQIIAGFPGGFSSYGKL